MLYKSFFEGKNGEFGKFMYSHYENWIEYRKTKPGYCESNLLFHQELSLGESADIAKIQARIDHYVITVFVIFTCVFTAVKR